MQRLEVSCAVRRICTSLGAKGLTKWSILTSACCVVYKTRVQNKYRKRRSCCNEGSNRGIYMERMSTVYFAVYLRMQWAVQNELRRLWVGDWYAVKHLEVAVASPAYYRGTCYKAEKKNESLKTANIPASIWTGHLRISTASSLHQIVWRGQNYRGTCYKAEKKNESLKTANIPASIRTGYLRISTASSLHQIVWWGQKNSWEITIGSLRTKYTNQVLSPVTSRCFTVSCFKFVFLIFCFSLLLAVSLQKRRSIQQFSGHHNHQYPYDRDNEHVHLNKMSTTIALI